MDDIYQKATNLISSEKFEEALTYFEELIKLQPGHSDAHILQLSMLANLMRFQEAIQSADHMLENKLVSEENLPAVYLIKGTSLYGLEQYDRSCKWL